MPPSTYPSGEPRAPSGPRAPSWTANVASTVTAPIVTRSPDVDLGHVGEAATPQQPAQAARDDDGRRAADDVQRGEIEVVVVGVGDEHRVEIAQLLEREARSASQVGDARAEQRVGQEARPVQLDEHASNARRR